MAYNFGFLGERNYNLEFKDYYKQYNDFDEKSIEMTNKNEDF